MSARFIWFAAELSPLRITSVVTGSASTTPAPRPFPARYTTASARIGDHQAAGGMDFGRVAGVEVGGCGLLDDDRRSVEGLARAEPAPVDECEGQPLRPREREALDRARRPAVLQHGSGSAGP